MSFEDDLKAVVKDGADISGIMGQVEGMNPLNGLTKETAFDFIKGNQVLLSAFDSEVSKSVNSGVENFKNKGMVEILKQKEEALRKELNPEESEASKVAREFKEFKESVENEKKTSLLKDQLSAKAKELGFPDPMLIRDLAGLGENAEVFADKYIELFNTALNDKLSEEIKGKYTKTAPKMSDKTPADLDSKIKEARASGNTDLALKLQMMKDRQGKTA